MVFVEVAGVAREHYLIGLLKILTAQVIVAGLGGQGVESNFLQLIGVVHTAGDAEHTFQTEHHLHRTAQLRPLGGVIAMEGFVAPVQTVGHAVITTQVGQSFVSCLNVFRFRMLLIVDERFFEALCQIDAVDAALLRQHSRVQEAARVVKRLFMHQFGQIEQELVAGLIIKPVNDHQVVAPAIPRPKRPVIERMFGKFL